MKDSDVLKWGLFGYRPSNGENVKIYYNNKSSEKAFEEDGVKILRHFSLNSIIHYEYDRDRVQTIYGIKTPKVDDFCVIRNWIYKLLRSDMEKLFKENKD